LASSLRAGGRVYFCGNGGSAADAQHLAAELAGRFYVDRPGLDVEALHTNTSYLTAVANDYGYEEVFSRLVQAKVGKGDVLVALSTLTPRIQEAHIAVGHIICELVEAELFPGQDRAP
jgi:D-sedoheptulose 7-phosphate isomerase